MGLIDRKTKALGGSLSHTDNGPNQVQKKYISSLPYEFSYYSGSQISIWFGDIWVEDINEISFQYSQQKRPIYGYASQYFDAVAEGQVLIQGNFVVNFKEKGYISYIINNIPKLESAVQTAKSGDDTKEELESMRDLISTHLKHGTFGPKSFLDLQTLAEEDDFLGQAKLYEDIVWGDFIVRDKVEPYRTPDIAQSNRFPDGFNILITYGSIEAAESNNINDITSATSKSLNGIHLVGSSQVIRATGEPVQEAYAFMAKGMDNYEGTSF